MALDYFHVGSNIFGTLFYCFKRRVVTAINQLVDMSEDGVER